MYAPQGYEPLRETHEAAKIGFILTELDLALTFCKIADSADDEGRASRNRAHARKAYDSAIHFLGSATLTESQSRRYQEANGLASLLHVSRGERLHKARCCPAREVCRILSSSWRAWSSLPDLRGLLERGNPGRSVDDRSAA